MIEVLNSNDLVANDDEEEKIDTTNKENNLLFSEFKYGFNFEFSDFYKHLEVYFT